MVTSKIYDSILKKDEQQPPRRRERSCTNTAKKKRGRNAVARYDLNDALPTSYIFHNAHTNVEFSSNHKSLVVDLRHTLYRKK